MSSTQPLNSSDAAATLASAVELVRARREVEAEELQVVAHWADLHRGDPAGEPAATVAPGADRLRRFGGDGTPEVWELATYELAVARGESVQATRALLADTLDLRHRLPWLWMAVQCCEVPAWLARKVAAAARVLPADRCRVVDQAVARAVGQPPSKVLELADAKVVEADPDAHAARVEAERLRRYASLTRADAAGMRTLIARMRAGDAAAADATITRVADILDARARAEHLESTSPVPVPTRDQLRAEAVTWLARPAELLVLLLEHTGDVPAPDLPPEPDPEPEPQPEPEPEPAGGRSLLAFPADLLEALRSRDLSGLRPRAVLYLHLHQQALVSGVGVARVEGLGPANLEHLAELLGHRQVTVQPVLDLADRVSTAAYEFPADLKRRLHLIFDGDAFPHPGTRPRLDSRRLDHDHVVPYRPTVARDTGPPGEEHQTSVTNGQPLSRGAHRAKTHLPYSCEPLDLGAVRWRTPQGLTRIVDHRGTHEECWVEGTLRRILAEHAAA